MFTFTDSQIALLDEVHYAVLGTLNPNGSIQQTVVWYLREEHTICFSAGGHSFKVRNLRLNPTCTVTIEDGGRYLSVSGTAEVRPVDPDLRYRMAVRYLGAERAAEWMTRRPDAARVSVLLYPQRAYGQRV